MIYSYGVSLPGTYHIKNGIVCQDYHAIASINKKVSVAAVADGLGSAAHSDVGSKIAATVAVEFCKKHLVAAKTIGDILDTIRSAFSAALRAVEKEANAKDRDPNLYDTTLTLAVLFNDTLCYGHSGDSGIVALTTDGKYELVTMQQQDDQGRVFPLFFEDKWVVELYDKKVSAVLLATDGMLESFFPIYIRNNEVKIHVLLMQFFMDNGSLQIDKVGNEVVQSKISKFMENIPDEQVNDDKTVAVLINPSVKTLRQPDEYYREPNWAELKRKHDEAWKREAYPGLYKTQDSAPEQTPEPPANLQIATASNTPASIVPISRNLPVEKLLRKPRIPRVLLFVIPLTVLVVTGALALVLVNMGNGEDVESLSETLYPPPIVYVPVPIPQIEPEPDVQGDDTLEYMSASVAYIKIAGEQQPIYLTELVLSDRGLTDADISNIYQMSNLVFLNLNGNQIIDLTPFRELQSLEILYLSSNQVDDLTPLRYLSYLTELRVDENKINDLEPLSDLTRLTILDVSYNQINDLAPLSNLLSLSELLIDRTEISDLEPLSSLTSLVILNANYNRIDDLSPLSNLSYLSELRVDRNQINDLEPLHELMRMGVLSANDNWISDLTPLGNLSYLSELRVDRNHIINLEPLSGLVNLAALHLAHNQIDDLVPLNGIASLSSLYLDGNKISELSSLSDLLNLTSLYMSRNFIVDLSPLQYLENLTDLNLDNNQIEDLNPLSSLANLQVLSLLHNTQITYWYPVEHVPEVHGKPARLTAT